MTVCCEGCFQDPFVKEFIKARNWRTRNPVPYSKATSIESGAVRGASFQRNVPPMAITRSGYSAPVMK